MICSEGQVYINHAIVIILFDYSIYFSKDSLPVFSALNMQVVQQVGPSTSLCTGKSTL